MNSIVLVGRLGKDPETRNTANGTPVVSFSLGVDRIQKGERVVDWIDCTAFDKTGKLIMDWVKKGHRIGIVGSLQTRTWKDNDGKSHKFTFVMVDKVEFLNDKSQAEQAPTRPDDMPFET